MMSMGVTTVICTDISKDGAMKGVNRELYKELSEKYKIDITASGGVTDMIFNSLSNGRIYLMPSIKAVDQIWVPTQTLMGDIAKDPFREKNGETPKFVDVTEIQTAIEKVSQDVYDAIFTLVK